MDKSFRNSESNSIEQFIEYIIETDQGFSELSYDMLVEFAQYIQREYETLPKPQDSTWEKVMELASDLLIDNPEDS